MIGNLDSFALRDAIASAGMRIEIVNESTVMVLGLDDELTRGVQLATGRGLLLSRLGDPPVWWCERTAFGECVADRNGTWGGVDVCTLADLQPDLEWVRQRYGAA